MPNKTIYQKPGDDEFVIEYQRTYKEIFFVELSESEAYRIALRRDLNRLRDEIDNRRRAGDKKG